MMLLPVILILAGCPPVLEPTIPFTSRAVETGWGEAVNGLSISAATNRDTLDINAEMRFEIFFRFWPFDSDGHVKLLHWGGRQARVALTLSAAGGPETYTRPAHDFGGPFIIPPDPADLRAGVLPSETERFYLLSPEGEPVPPGDYLLRLTYDNPTWAGVLQTAPLPLYVSASAADTTWCELPSRVEVVEQPTGQLMWRWDDGSFEPATIVSRPGYHLGFSVEVRKFIGDEPVKAPPREDETALAEFFRTFGSEWSRNLGGGLPRRPVSGASGLTGPGIREALADGQVLRAEFDAVVFETSNPPQSHWRPETGDYRPLREYKVVAVWPESR